MVFGAIALIFVLTSGLTWKESKRAWLFIIGFLVFFSVLIFLTGRGSSEFYTTEHIFAKWEAHFKILGWRPALTITAEETVYAISTFVRVFSIASMTILIPYSLNPTLYGVAFRGLGLPDKIAYGMDLTMRFIPTFARDFTLTMDAQKARGYEIEKLKGGLTRPGAQAGTSHGPCHHPRHRRQRGYHRRHGPACIRHWSANMAG